MDRNRLRQLFRLGLAAALGLVGVRLVPRLLAAQRRRRNDAALRTTEALWPPVPPSSHRKAQVGASLASEAVDGERPSEED